MMEKVSEHRARQVAKDLMKFRNWKLDPVMRYGQAIEENEYKSYPHLSKIFKGQSKTGKGDGYPDFLMVNSSVGKKPLLIVETKPYSKQINSAIEEAIHYGEACISENHDVVCVGVAGGEKEVCNVSVKRKVKNQWVSLTLNGVPIDWIPSSEQIERLLTSRTQTEVAPEKPGAAILAEQANRINEILRECKIKDEFRPIYIATIMLALWHGDVSVSSNVVLTQINANASQALIDAGKGKLQHSLRVDDQNSALAAQCWEIVDILKKLNIQSFIREHDYLGQLYETFFRYTGGNTIGQYFTPRHIIEFMCDICDISPNDKILDPACGTGGFLIGALNTMVARSKKPYEEAVDIVKNNLFGIESEPATAALCITNMILRGDGKSGIIKEDCFATDFPKMKVDFVLMNPPFPHNKKTDTPTTKFLDRGLQSLKDRGILAAVVPYSLLVNMSDWHSKILRNNTLYFVATLPADVFQPYASYNTAILMIQKGVPHRNKKVFMARMFNDGFKLKKGNRVEKKGSHLPLISNAFISKDKIPEITAYPEINENSTEWSPENYIENAIHSDIEFVNGFEQHIRKHASFYISNGNKISAGTVDISKSELNLADLFSDKSNINLDNITTGAVLVDDYFNISLGGNDEIEDLDEGNCPIVSTSEFMNGVTAWRNPNRIYPYPSITVATDGSVCSSFVQEFPYYAFYKVAILAPKQEIPTDALYYISYLLFRERWRYVYARKFGKARIRNTTLIMPVDKKGSPDFNKMAKLTQMTRAYSIVSMFKNVTVKKQKIGLTDAELAAKYDTGEQVDFDSALKSMAKVPSKFALAKPPKPKR